MMRTKVTKLRIMIVLVAFFAALTFFWNVRQLRISNSFESHQYQLTASNSKATVDLMIFNMFWPLLLDGVKHKHNITRYETAIAQNCKRILQFNYSTKTNTDLSWKYVFVGDIPFLNKYESFVECMNHTNAFSIHVPYDELPHEQHANVSNPSCGTKFGGLLFDGGLNWYNRIWLSKRAIILNLVKQHTDISSYVHPTNTALIYMDVALRQNFWPALPLFVSNYHQFDNEYVYTLRSYRYTELATKHIHRKWFNSSHCVTAPLITASLSFYSYQSGVKYEEQFNYYLNATTYDIINNKTKCECFDEEMIQSKVERESNISTKAIYGELFREYNKCNISKSILFGSHHKTGTLLLLSISQQVEKHMNYVSPNTTVHIHMERVLEAYAIDPFIAAQNICNRYIIHVIRHPADTIISAYNFHKGAAREAWFAKIKIINLRESGNKRITQLEKGEPRFHQSHRMICVADMFEEYFANDAHLNMTIKQMLNSINISDGIYFEYLLYFECVFPEITRSTNIVAESADVNGLNVFLEEFEHDFNQTCIKILKHLDIEYDEKLLKELNRFNVYKAENKSEIRKPKHITFGTFNKTQQLEILLSDLQRCKTLKNMSNEIEATWIYDEFC